MIASTEHRSSSNSPGVADDWENEEGETAMQRQLEERFEQVRIMQREKADKDARKERARAEEEAHAVSSSEGSAVPVTSQQNLAPVKMQILRRPTSGDKLASEEERARKEQEERGRKKPTMEEREAAYQLARSRIMGVDYKPEPSNAPQTPITPPSSRNKSPEQIRVRKPSPEGMYMPMMPHHMQPAVMSPYMMHGMPAQQMPYCQVPITTATMNPQMQQYQVPITTAPGYMTYFDTSRPPPSMVNPMMNPGPSVQYAHPAQQQIPTYATGQYYGGPMANMGMRMPPQQQQVPFGRPPMALYPSGTLGAAMQVNLEPGQSQAQRKNRQNKKKSRASGGGEE